MYIKVHKIVINCKWNSIYGSCRVFCIYASSYTPMSDNICSTRTNLEYICTSSVICNNNKANIKEP